MERNVRVAVIGVGEMGRVLTRQLVERGVQIVGAFGRRSNIGCDLGEVAGVGRTLGVPVRNDLADALPALHPDVAFVTTQSELADMMPLFGVCASAGVNVITAAEEPFYAWDSSPALARELDGLAKAAGVTVFAGGIQDTFWLGLPLALSGACNRIERICGIGGCDADNYGSGTAKILRIGKTEAEYRASVHEMPVERDFFGLAQGALARALGDEVAHFESEVVPLFAERSTFSCALGRDLNPGEVIGQKQITRARTAAGVEVETVFITSAGEEERNIWRFFGDPDIEVDVPRLPGPAATCAALVNRLPDILAAPVGYRTAADLTPIRYRRT